MEAGKSQVKESNVMMVFLLHHKQDGKKVYKKGQEETRLTFMTNSLL